MDLYSIIEKLNFILGFLMFVLDFMRIMFWVFDSLPIHCLVLNWFQLPKNIFIIISQK